MSCALADSPGERPSREAFLWVRVPRVQDALVQPHVEIAVQEIPRFPPSHIRRGDPAPADGPVRWRPLSALIPQSDQVACDRTYGLPCELKLEPKRTYRMAARIRVGRQPQCTVNLLFHTDRQGLPLPY